MRIIATIGPSSTNKEMINKLINNGVDTLRLNFSHFYEEQFRDVIIEARRINKDICIMADLCGRKIRVYEKIKKVYKVYKDEEVFFCSNDVYEVISNNEENLKLIPLTLKSKEIKENEIKSISMKDGTMNFEIIDKNEMFLKARAKNEGVIRGGKGCNIPDIKRGKYILSDSDKKCLKWALDNKVDIIGQSFVENSSEIIEIRKFIETVYTSKNTIKIFAKLETSLGIRNYEDILNVSDGIIIARGDLVPECGLINSVFEEMYLLSKLNDAEYKKEVIVATHLLDSMKYNELPIIAELESIYNFIKYGVNGFLLAGETSVGRRANETVIILKEIIERYM